MAKELVAIIVALGAVAGTLILIIFGVTDKNPELITIAVGILSFGFGAVINNLFPSIKQLLKKGL